MMHFFDTVHLDASGRRRTADGYLVAMARAARSGIQIYRGVEVGRPDLRDVRVYRPPDEVFSRDSLSTYAHKPLTNEHPAEPVTAANWKDHAVGFVGDEIARDGEHVRIPLMLADAAAIDALEAGKRELSAGYSCRLVWEPGVTDTGEAYDAKQVEIRINHVAMVDAGRAGPSARIDDADGGKASDKPRSPHMSGSTSSIVVDGLTVTLDARDAQIVQRTLDKLNTDLAAANQKVADMAKKAKEDEEEYQKGMAKKDAEIDALKGKVLDEAALDARVQARADLISTAKAIVGDALDFKGKPDAEIRKAVVVAKLGDEAVKDKPAAYIDARFDILAEGVKDGGGQRQPSGDDGSTVIHAGDAWGGVLKKNGLLKAS